MTSEFLNSKGSIWCGLGKSERGLQFTLRVKFELSHLTRALQISVNYDSHAMFVHTVVSGTFSFTPVE